MGVYLKGKTWYLNFHYNKKRYTERIGPDGPVNITIAKEKLIIKQREVIQGEYKPKVVQTAFSNFIEDYLKYSRGNKKPKSSLRDECSLKHLKPFFGGKMLSDISPFLIEKYKVGRKEQEAEPATINRELSCLRNMFNMAMTWGKAQNYPFGKNRVKFLKEPKGKDRILSDEEEARLLETVRTSHKEKHLEPIIITALNTGMRKGEILNLKWSNVDFRNGFIVVEGSKNGEVRRIPMNQIP